MIRRAFRLLAGVSLLLCVATGLEWRRSYRIVDQLNYFTSRQRAPQHLYALWLGNGRATILLAENSKPWEGLWDPGFIHRAEKNNGDWSKWSAAPLSHDTHGPAVFGFQTLSNPDPFGGPVYERFIEVPLYSVVALFAAVPLVQLRSWRKRRRSGICKFCGYDLRASPERCPECGKTPV